VPAPPARFITCDREVLAAEIAALGTHPLAAASLAHESAFLAVRLSGLATRATEALAGEMRAQGGQVIASDDQQTVLVLGSRAEFDGLVAALQSAEADLPRRARELRDLLDTLDRSPAPLQLGRFTLPLGERTLVMGILNMTPDSFSGDGLGANLDAAVARAQAMQAAGADIVDVGGMSTRPGAEEISTDQELARVVPLVRRLASEIDLPISIDTYRATVAEAALAAGAVIVNDITGLDADPALAAVVAAQGAGLVLMHIQGRPRTMQHNPHYGDLLGEIHAYLWASRDRAIAAGVPPTHIWADPGIGFGKTGDHNLQILRRLGELRSLGMPILIGTSRKWFIGSILGGRPPAERVSGTGATLVLGVAHGADIVRVHDVGPAVDVVRVADAIVRHGGVRS